MSSRQMERSNLWHCAGGFGAFHALNRAKVGGTGGAAVRGVPPAGGHADGGLLEAYGAAPARDL